MSKEEWLKEMEVVLRDLLRECRIQVDSDSKASDWVIYGPQGLLNSLQLMQYVVDLEEKYLQLTGKVIVIASAKALSHRESPFRNLHTLADFILNTAHA